MKKSKQIKNLELKIEALKKENESIKNSAFNNDFKNIVSILEKHGNLEYTIDICRDSDFMDIINSMTYTFILNRKNFR